MNMNKKKLLRRLVLFGFANIFTAIAWAGTDEPSGRIYTAEKDGASIVIVGVRHGPASSLPPVQLREPFERSTTVMPEFDMTDPARRKSAALDILHGREQAANKFLSGDELDLVHAAWVKKMNGKAAMTPGKLGQLHACGISSFLLPANGKQKPASAQKRHPPWEYAFVSQGKAKGKSIVELEPQGPLTSCSAMPRDQVRAFLLEAVKLGSDEARNAEYLRRLEMSNSSAENGDGEAAYQHMLEALSFSQAYKAAFLNYMAIRNNTMAEAMALQHAKLPASGSVFVLVGGLHLHGDTGLLALLARKGFNVKTFPVN